MAFVLKLTDTALVCAVINAYGDGSHPHADQATLRHFNRNYAIACLDKARAKNPSVEEITHEQWLVKVEQAKKFCQTHMEAW
jgi:hypothetical protein